MPEETVKHKEADLSGQDMPADVRAGLKRALWEQAVLALARTGLWDPEAVISWADAIVEAWEKRGAGRMTKL